MKCKPEDWKKCKKIFLIIVAIIIIVMIALVVSLTILDKKAPESVPQNISQNGDVEFTGPEYKPSKVYDDSNKEVSLEKLAEKPMALVFFNTSNEKSLETLEIFAKYEETYSEKLNIVGICISDGITENVETVQKTLSSNQINLKNILFDSDYSAKSEYNVEKIPTLVFVNKNKEIINTLSKEEDINEDVIMANLDILSENY